MQQITYSILFNKYFDLDKLLLNEVIVKLGNKENKTNHIYNARFIMLVINHFVKETEINRMEDTLECWVQNKKVFKDLLRINLYSSLSLIYP